MGDPFKVEWQPTGGCEFVQRAMKNIRRINVSPLCEVTFKQHGWRTLLSFSSRIGGNNYHFLPYCTPAQSQGHHAI